MAQVLIIEDSPTQAQQLALLLEDAGFDVTIAPNAERGYASLTKQKFDLVVADVNLPGESGFEICRRIKANPELKAIPIIVVTSYALSGDEEKARAAG